MVLKARYSTTILTWRKLATKLPMLRHRMGVFLCLDEQYIIWLWNH